MSNDFVGEKTSRKVQLGWLDLRMTSSTGEKRNIKRAVWLHKKSLEITIPPGTRFIDKLVVYADPRMVDE